MSLKTNVSAVVLCIAFGAVLNAGTVYTKIESPGLAITDYNTVESSLVIPDPLNIESLTLQIENLTHSSVGDLRIWLEDPDNVSILVFDQHGGSGDSLIGMWLDDRTTRDIGTQVAPFAGIFAPDNSMAAFRKTYGAGTWKLLIQDNAGGDQGYLTSWSIAVNEPVPEPSTAALLGAASIAGSAVALLRRRALR
jgi:serine protease